MKGKRISQKTEEKKSGFQDYKCYITYDPASVLMGGFQLEQRIREDFERFTLRSLRSPLSCSPKHVERIGFDTEYDPKGNLLTVGIADSNKAEAFETSEAGWKKKITPIIKKAKVICGHSVAGDLDYLCRLGWCRNDWLNGRNIRDSFLLARMSDENRGKGAYGLESLLLSEFNFQPWKAETEKLIKKTGDARDWSVEQRTARCRLDAWAAHVLAEHFERRLNDNK